MCLSVKKLLIRIFMKIFTSDVSWIRKIPVGLNFGSRALLDPDLEFFGEIL